MGFAFTMSGLQPIRSHTGCPPSNTSMPLKTLVIAGKLSEDVTSPVRRMRDDLMNADLKSRFLLLICLITTSLIGQSLAAEPLIQRSVSFAADPQWEGFRNQLLPDRLPVVKQEFGYRSTQLAAGTTNGEIGGQIQRSIAPAWYAKKITPLSLKEPFSVSGRFCVPRADAGSGIMIGWFHESSRGWRTPNSIALRIDGNGGKYWAFYEYGTETGKTGGAGAFEGDRYQTTPTRPFLANNQSHRFRLAYDPVAGNGQGAVLLTIDETNYPPVVFPKEHRREGMTLNRFGIWNVQVAGKSAELYLDDLRLNEDLLTFDVDPRWEGNGNQTQFTERIIRPFHDFGFQPTSFIDPARSALGGVIFRDEKPAYYAVDVGQVSLDDPLRAAGKIRMQSSAADSGFCLGWFNAADKRNHQVPEHERRSSNYLAAMIEGPSRIGHYFRASYSNSRAQGFHDGDQVTGSGPLPVLRSDGKVHHWQLRYEPSAADGRGEIEVNFDDQRRVISLRPGDRQSGAVFDRFGIFNIQSGGHQVQFSVEDLEFTSRR